MIIPVPREEEGHGCYSHVFLVKKPSGTFWLILEPEDIKQIQIQEVPNVHNFLSEESSNIRLLPSVHSVDAYLHVPIAPASQ